jgi:hypothetical protein
VPCEPAASPHGWPGAVWTRPSGPGGTGVVERSLSWLLGCRRLGVRYECRADLLRALLHLACALLCLRSLAPVDG